ncbi:uncharacterized protein RSE6_07791 [Rhynchosporium secalis]|uniref:Uncharacterized protein n=1 Tax=Rhynchosporium secalis TaxID=38038 RepID=A0A1E1MDR7_RHYSE|nr:uncharacterized protein RSE6_07791 [Rhynchosporium secalis]
MAFVVDLPEQVRALHKNLATKYRHDGARVEQLWRSFDKNQRARILFGITMEGTKILNKPTDTTLGNVNLIIPEINMLELTVPGDDRLLDLLQYKQGVGEELGDAGFIERGMRANDLRSDLTISHRHSLNIYTDDEKYVERRRYPNKGQYDDSYALFFGPATSGACLPTPIGDFVLKRQHHTIISLIVIFNYILTIDTAYRTAKADLTNSTAVSSEAVEQSTKLLSFLSIAALPQTLTLNDIVSGALDMKSSREEILELCRKDSTVLLYMATSWLFLRPELVKDDKGQCLSIIDDSFNSQSIFDMAKDMVISVATWEYIHRLLLLINGQPVDGTLRAIAVQELSNVCDIEHRRSRRQLIHSLRRGSCAKYLVRIPGAWDDGFPLVKVKGKPDLKKEPQDNHLLSLCQKSDAAESIAHVRNVDELHRSDPANRARMHSSGYDALGNLAATVSFIIDVRAVIPMPDKSGKKNQIYLSRSEALTSELESVREAIDLSAFVVEIAKLNDDNNTRGTWQSLDATILERTGTTLETLYEDLIDQCMEDIHRYHEQQQTKSAQKMTVPQPYVPVTEISSSAERIEQRREKDKSRPAHSSFFHASVIPAEELEEEEVEPQVFRVKQDTLNTFSVLFPRDGKRGSIHWTAFEAAMADLEFSAVPKFGSVYTFLPPAGMGTQKSLTVHRPHQPKIEGHVLLAYASRLRRVYGWGPGTFELG